jgi:hypothetical protein
MIRLNNILKVIVCLNLSGTFTTRRYESSPFANLPEELLGKINSFLKPVGETVSLNNFNGHVNLTNRIADMIDGCSYFMMVEPDPDMRGVKHKYFGQDEHVPILPTNIVIRTEGISFHGICIPLTEDQIAKSLEKFWSETDYYGNPLAIVPNFYGTIIS